MFKLLLARVSVSLIHFRANFYLLP